MLWQLKRWRSKQRPSRLAIPSAHGRNSRPISGQVLWLAAIRLRPGVVLSLFPHLRRSASPHRLPGPRFSRRALLRNLLRNSDQRKHYPSGGCRTREPWPRAPQQQNSEQHANTTPGSGRSVAASILGGLCTTAPSLTELSLAWQSLAWQSLAWQSLAWQSLAWQSLTPPMQNGLAVPAVATAMAPAGRSDARLF